MDERNFQGLDKIIKLSIRANQMTIHVMLDNNLVKY